MDWDAARRRDKTGRSSGTPSGTNRRTRRATGTPKPVNPRASQYPPTPAQIGYLQDLCVKLGVRYTKPLTRRQASARIRDLEALRRK